MGPFPPFFFCNRRGIPRLDVSSITVTTTAVEFNLANNAFRFLEESGLVLIRISTAIPTGTTSTLPVVFQSNDATQAITNVGGVPLTAADIPSTGIYLFYYDKNSKLMQILSRTE